MDAARTFGARVLPLGHVGPRIYRSDRMVYPPNMNMPPMQLPPNLVRVGLTVFRVDSDFRVLARFGVFTIDGYATPPADAITELSSLVGPLAYGVPLDPVKFIQAAKDVMNRTSAEFSVQYRD